MTRRNKATPELPDEALPPTGIFASTHSMLSLTDGAFNAGELVYITEKLDGENMRLVFADNRLHVGSRSHWRLEKPGDSFWNVVTPRMREMALLHSGTVFYGEKVTGGFYCFDALDIFGNWLPYTVMRRTGMPVVPELYVGPWDLTTAQHLANYPGREGVVIQPATDREVNGVGRLKLKLLNEGVKR